MFEIIITCIIIWVMFKLYRFWTVNELNYSENCQTIFNRKLLDLTAIYEPGTIPAPYPNLWYPVIQSRKLKPGQVKPIYAIGRDLAVFRSLSGKVHVLDAFCPHFGAHLGVGGSVVGENIRCPFHSWQFNGQGVCTLVPGLQADKTPKAILKSWNSVELNGWVYVWYHDEDQEPKWLPFNFKELKHSEHCGKAIEVQHGHLEDILSNTADIGHFDELHSLAGIISPWQILRRGKLYTCMRNIFYIDYQASWCHGTDQDSHVACMQAIATPVLFGFPLSIFQIITKAQICPPTYNIVNTLTKLNISFYLLSVLLPISPMKNVFIHNVYGGPGFFSKLFARIGFYSVVPSTEPDKIIYNNKKFLNNPCYTSLDKDLVKFSHWFKENFYSQSSNKTNLNN